MTFPTDQVPSGLRLDGDTSPTDKVGPNGTYSVPRECPHCGFVTVSRDAYWRHYFAKHEEGVCFYGACPDHTCLHGHLSRAAADERLLNKGDGPTTEEAEGC